MILLDTHVLLWTETAPEKLSSAARAAMLASSERLAVSVVSLWEIALLRERGRILLHKPIEVFLGEIEAAYRLIPLSAAICIRGAGLPAEFPRDPMDRLIAATAITREMTLVTADRAIQAAEVCAVAW